MHVHRLTALLCAVLCCTAPVTAADPYDVDAILPLTGPNAFVGNEQKQSLEILQADVNRGGGVHGRAIRFIIVDSQSNPQIAVQLAGGVVAKHPLLVIGDSALSTCAAMAPLLAENNVLQFCLSPGFTPKLNSTQYQIGTPPPQQADAVMTYARMHGWTRVAMLNQNDATGDSAVKSMTGSLERPQNKALHVVAAERFSPGDISIAAQLSRIRAAGAQFIVTYNSGAPFGIVARGLHDAGIDLPVVHEPGQSLVRRTESVRRESAAPALLRLGPVAARWSLHRKRSAESNRCRLPRRVPPPRRSAGLGQCCGLGHGRRRHRGTARARTRRESDRNSRLYQ